MPNLSPTCQKIQKQIDALKGEKKALQDDLKEASPSQKAGLSKQIKALDPKIAAKQAELAECVKKHPAPGQPEENPCLAQKKELDKLRAALREEIQKAIAPLQAELHEASPQQKPAIVKEIKKTREAIQKNSPTAKKIAEKKKAYDRCLTDNGGKTELRATFKGFATFLTSNPHAGGPFQDIVEVGLYFSDWDHREVTAKFPSFTTEPYSTPAGTGTTTVSQISAGGTFSPETNRITLDLVLFFNHSLAVAGDSRLEIRLKTVSPLNAAGAIELEGSSKFKNGFLDGDTCWLTVAGLISPRP